MNTSNNSNSKAIRARINAELNSLKKRLKKAIQSPQPNYAEIACTHNELAAIFLSLEDYQAALDSVKKAITTGTGKVGLLQMAAFYKNMGTAYNALKNSQNAVMCLQKCIHIREMLQKHNTPEAAAYSLKHDTPTSYYQKAITYHQNQVDLALTYNDLGDILHEMNKNDLAIDYYNKAINIQINLPPLYRSHLINTYSCMSTLYEEEKNYDLAIFYYQKEITIAEILFPNEARLATAYNSMSSLYYETEQYNEALDYSKKAIALGLKTLPLNNAAFAIFYQTIALIYEAMKQYTEAIDYYQQSIQISEKGTNPEQLFLAATYQHLGGIYCSLGKKIEAKEHLQKAITIWETPEYAILLTDNYRELLAIAKETLNTID